MHLSADVSPPLESPSHHRIFCGRRSLTPSVRPSGVQLPEGEHELAL